MPRPRELALGLTIQGPRYLKWAVSNSLDSLGSRKVWGMKSKFLNPLHRCIAAMFLYSRSFRVISYDLQRNDLHLIFVQLYCKRNVQMLLQVFLRSNTNNACYYSKHVEHHPWRLIYPSKFRNTILVNFLEAVYFFHANRAQFYVRTLENDSLSGGASNFVGCLVSDDSPSIECWSHSRSWKPGIQRQR